MRQIQHDSYVAGIDDEARLAIVQNALQDSQARLVSWRKRRWEVGGRAPSSTQSRGGRLRRQRRPLEVHPQDVQPRGRRLARRQHRPDGLELLEARVADLSGSLDPRTPGGSSYAALLRIRRAGRDRCLGGNGRSHRSRPATVVGQPIRDLRDISVDSTAAFLSTLTRQPTRG